MLPSLSYLRRSRRWLMASGVYSSDLGKVAGYRLWRQIARTEYPSMWFTLRIRDKHRAAVQGAGGCQTTNCTNVSAGYR